MSRQRVVSYAQNREDIILSGFFTGIQNGFYVDIGANHPVNDSVTKYFYDKGWRGINVEPNGRLIRFLKEARPRDTNIQAGIADKNGTMVMREYEGWYDGLSTFSKEMQEENAGVAKYRDVEVEVITLEELFSRYEPQSIDFMKIDVEGFELNVLKGNNWDKYRPKIICIEANHLKRDWYPILENANYNKVFFDGLNEYYVSHEARKLAEDFSYVNAVVGTPIISAELDKNFSEIESELEQYKTELEFYRSENARLNAELVESKMIIPLLKQLAKTIDAGMRRRILALNSHEQRAKLQPFAPTNINDPEDLLMQVRRYDFNVYYTKKPQKDRLVYLAVNNTYSFISDLAFRLGKTGVRVLRRLKR